MLTRIEDFTFDSELQEMCDYYFEFDIHQTAKLVITIKNTDDEEGQRIIDAEEIRFRLFNHSRAIFGATRW